MSTANIRESGFGERTFLTLSKCLSEPVMGFLAFIALVLTIAPSLFSNFGKWANIGIWIIVGLFFLEYVANLMLAPVKKVYILRPWRLLDLAIIVAPFGAVLPGVGNKFASSPVLRLIRVLRVGVFGLRAGEVIVREQVPASKVEEHGLPLVSVVKMDGQQQPRQASWYEFQMWEAGRENQWYHVSNIGPERFDELAKAAEIPLAFIESCLSDANFPRIESYRNATLLSAWLPSLKVEVPSLAVERTSILMVIAKNSLVTASRPHYDLQNLMMKELDTEKFLDVPLVIRVMVAFLQTVLRRNEELTAHLERRLRALENVPIKNSRTEFFSQTFQMKKELSAVRADLWRFKGILTILAGGRVLIDGANEKCKELFQMLADQADYLHDTADNLREGVLSVIDLHLNVVSLDINRFMRVVAAVSALGLIPTIVGGLLGMNLVGNPWPFTLAQVTFCVAIVFLACLYILIVKKWLR